MTLLQRQEGILVAVVGSVRAINTGFASAMATEGWCVREFASVTSLLAQPPHPCALVLLPVPEVSGQIEATIRYLAGTLALPVVVFCPDRKIAALHTALCAGAEDVIAIPITIEEGIARLHAVMRVRFAAVRYDDRATDYVVMNTTRMVSVRGGSPVRLSLNEYRVFRLLHHMRNQPVPRAHLQAILHLQGPAHKDEALAALINRLRRKVGADRVVSTRGIGYQLLDFAELATSDQASSAGCKVPAPPADDA